MMEINKIYQGDSVSLLDGIPDRTFDLICTDPPYRTTSRGNAGSMGGYWNGKKTMSGKIFDTNDIKIEDYLDKLYRVLKDDAHCYIVQQQESPSLHGGCRKVKFSFCEDVGMG